MSQPLKGDTAFLPTTPIDEHALECLGDTTLSSFTASPSTLPPSGAAATLSWAVAVPTAGCVVKVKLNGRSVARSGSQQVHPAVSTRYSLTAHAGRLSKPLGSVDVRVDTGACLTVPVPESLVRSAITSVVDALDQADSRFRQRSRPTVEIDAGGIRVALRFVVAINNFADPDLDIDFVIRIRVRSGTADAFLQSFSVDVDWPLWVTVVTAGASKIVEEFLDARIERELKPRLLTEVKRLLDGFVAQLPGGLRLHTIALGRDEIRVTACPAVGDAPFLVLPTPV
ncbi:MAG: hypothetical protein ACRD0Q_07900 [Acidimicrobiales bacterium]